jgi:hypothetical protein
MKLPIFWPRKKAVIRKKYEYHEKPISVNNLNAIIKSTGI